MSQNQHGPEPVPGLPERLPEGEHLLWQGAPDWWSLARRGFHVDKVVGYFGVAILAVVAADVANGAALGAALASALWLLVPTALAAGLLAGLAWCYARMTLYTMTDARVVIRSGIALPTAVNLPYERVASAGVKQYRDGTGDITLRLDHSSRRPSLAMLWPNVRPFRWARPEPTLRCVAEAGRASGILGDALQARAAGTGPAEATASATDENARSSGAEGAEHGTGSGDRVVA